MKKSFLLAVAAGAALVAVSPPAPTASPFASKVTIRFRLFDAKVPADEFAAGPKADVTYRENPAEQKTFTDVPVTKGADGFYRIAVDRGVLIQSITLRAVAPDRVVNPAFLTKVVSRDDMTVYLGASVSTEEFRPQAFTAQMVAYRETMLNALQGKSPTDAEAIRAKYRAEFEPALRNMAAVAADARLLTDDPAERVEAQRLVTKVLELYGIPVARPVVCCQATATLSRSLCRPGLFFRHR